MASSTRLPKSFERRTGTSNTELVRPRARGKFLWANDVKLYVRGATYGTFGPGNDGTGYPDPDIVGRDFEQMADAGLNSVRTYTVPPLWLLDSAERYGLRVMVGLPWEQHIAFLDDRSRSMEIEHRIRSAVNSCAEHPAVLCYAIGNEIPGSIVRWYGARRIERFLERLYYAVKSEDAGALTTYVNYPTTEYLDLPFLDFVTFNVYLESPEVYLAYLSRLQNQAGDRPLVMAEIGMDSLRNGEDAQARALDWQIRLAFQAGCAGAFVFSWTDEWHRGGHDVEDWDFGLTDRRRRPKRALQRVARAFADSPFGSDNEWPRVTVVVCTHNGERTLRECLLGLKSMRYPDYEVVVVNDGSTDKSALVASEFGYRLINTSNNGLSEARNTGLHAATGEIIAYLDDDALPDPDWLSYLAQTFCSTTHVAVGGPNIPPAGDGLIANCVTNAPGGPIHVLVSDQEAEHIPGCNMAFRRDALLKLGGFDSQFRAAGDDVDICWRTREHGFTIGFNPAAVVWHHRRNSVRAYLKQQVGYGKAEALLESKWPEKYNLAGHFTWSGRLYGTGFARHLGSCRSRIYQGVWGTAPFQSVYEPAPGTFYSMSLMPEWYMVIAGLALVSALGLVWTPLLVALVFLALAVTAVFVQAGMAAGRATFPDAPDHAWRTLQMRLLVAGLHIAQPGARLYGRIKHGLTPDRWRRRRSTPICLPRSYHVAIWNEQWMSRETWLQSLESLIRSRSSIARRGGVFDNWDMDICCGPFGSVRATCVIEEHGEGKQLARFRCMPRCTSLAIGIGIILVILFTLAQLSGNWTASIGIGVITVWLAVSVILDCGAARSQVVDSVDQFSRCNVDSESPMTQVHVE